ncbi:hypothetical protein HJG60_009582 [Phyllostomus discolor]|uniref:Uncharacterized protein n=1 Tax=Phyllostomus discolor TaxID=89673 RepID=A0A833Y3I8_9CHIR|nr:hypothetical protein HJG60_009582 [Phyllostomus discolor]
MIRQSSGLARLAEGRNQPRSRPLGQKGVGVSEPSGPALQHEMFPSLDSLQVPRRSTFSLASPGPRHPLLHHLLCALGPGGRRDSVIQCHPGGGGHRGRCPHTSPCNQRVGLLPPPTLCGFFHLALPSQVATNSNFNQDYCSISTVFHGIPVLAGPLGNAEMSAFEDWFRMWAPTCGSP